MKKIRILLLFALILNATSCFDDIGNYDYTTKEDVIPITISGVRDTTISVGNTLEITPILNNMDNENRYVYLWYASHQQTAGFAPRRDTLSLEKNLSVTLKMEAGTYNLVYEVRDPKLDVYVRAQSTLRVSASSINAGWYVLKDIDDETDFDYIKLDGSETTNDVLRNIGGYQEFSDGPAMFGNQQLKGKAIKMIWQNTGYRHEVKKQDGTISTLINQRAYHILTDKDFKTFNSDNLYLFKNFENQFYEAPPAAPRDICFVFFDLYLLNNNRAHSIYGMSSNVGKFAAPKTSSISPNHNLYSSLGAGLFGAIVFDKTTRSFFSTSSSGATLDKMASPPADSELPSLTEMEYDLINLLERNPSSAAISGYCLMKKNNSQDYYIGYIPSTYGDTGYLFNSFKKVPENAKMPTAQVKSVPLVASCIYFGNDNVLSYYLDATDIENNEKVIYTFAAGEKIAFISNPKSDTLIVLTNSTSGWKLYGFPIVGATPDIVAEPSFIYSGEGNGRYVMYRAS